MPAMKRRLVSKRVLVTLAIALVASVATGSWQIAAASNHAATQRQACATAEPAPDGGDIGAQSQVCTSPESPADASADAPAGSAEATPAGPGTAPGAAPTGTFSGPPPRAGFHEFPANCTVTHRLNDDPIVFPGLPGASHNHTFVGNPTTPAATTPPALLGGPTSCQDPKDASSYWFPTLLQNGVPVAPERVTVYYKSGVSDYRTVRPFPAGFRLVVGDARATSVTAFKGTWTCGGHLFTDIPSSCPAGSSLIVRLMAPSCWDGVNLDSPNHKSHMVYPVSGVCPADHPAPLPMLQMKVPYKLPGGNTSGLTYSSGPSFTFHYDFMNGWDPARQAQVISHCVNGGRQCNGLGIDRHKP
jgi:hypothetical protein